LSLNYYSNSVSIIEPLTGKVETFKLELAGKSYVNPTHAALSPDGLLAYVVSSGTDGNLLVFDLQKKQFTQAIPIDGLSFDVVVVKR
jgi:DNA-binding beta-propeller fold protein YncE